MTAVIPLNSRTILGLNQEAYQQLRLTLSLKLRRQLLIAVCDDAALQADLATRLEADLNESAVAEGAGSVDSSSEGDQAPAVVNLWLDYQKPDLARQVVLWCKQHNLTQARPNQELPTFQILGIDRLSRHSPSLQNRFLVSLVHLEPLLSRLEMRLVLWVSRPWLRKIRQSAPEVWRLRTGLFEFAGDPTPLTAVEGLPAPATPEKKSPVPVQPPRAEEATNPLQAIDFWTVLTEDLSALEAAAPASDVLPGPDAGVDPAQPTPTATTPVEPATPAPVPEPPADLSPSTATPPAKAATRPGLAIPSVLISFEEPEPVDEPAIEESEIAPLPEPPAVAAATVADAQLMALWQHIQALTQQQAGPLTLARAYLYFGQTCRDRIEAGQPLPELVDLAIEAYQQALPGLPAGSGEWCDGYNDLGSLYWLRSHRESNPELSTQWLRQATAAYHQVLDQTQGQPSPESLARLYSNLGTVHSLLASLDDPKAHLDLAVRAYHQALQHRSADIAPLEYAALQNSLGAIHWRLAQLGDHRNQLHRAITAYAEALKYRPPQDFPQEFAMIQNNLGIAYWNLAQHERPAYLLEQAVMAYQSALAYRTLVADPAGCAATHNNLGTAYWDLAQHQDKLGDRQIFLWQQALISYEAALTAAHRAQAQSPPLPLSFDLWATFHSAGVVHDQLAQHLPADQAEQRGTHLDQALLHYLTALGGWRTVPDRMALLKTALVHNIRLQFQIRGTEGQNAVLSKIPADLLPDVLPQL